MNTLQRREWSPIIKLQKNCSVTNGSNKHKILMSWQLCSVPISVIVMFPVVKFKMNQNNVLKMFQGGTFRMSRQFSHSVLLLAHSGRTPGTSQRHSKCSQFSSFLNTSLWCSWSFPRMCHPGTFLAHCSGSFWILPLGTCHHSYFGVYASVRFEPVHVLSPDHDSSPPMTCHVVSPFIFLISSHTFNWLLHSPLVVSILIVSYTSGWMPHFPLALLLCPSYTSDWPPHFLIFLYLSLTCQACTKMVCAPWSVHTLVAI